MKITCFWTYSKSLASGAVVSGLRPVEEGEANSKAREERQSTSEPEALVVAEWLPWVPRKRTWIWSP